MSRGDAWLCVLVICIVASCIRVDTQADWTIPETRLNDLHFRLVPQGEEGSFELQAESDPEPTPYPEYVPEPAPTPEQVGVWTIYRFPRRISIPTPVD